MGVAPLHSAAVLLALVLGAHRNGCLVRLHELLSPLSDVRLLRYHGDSVPQGRDAVRHLYHLAAVGADAGGHVRDGQGCVIPGLGRECHVNKTNSVLGLSMYASYFVL